MIALDTNVLVYAADPDAGERHRTAVRILALLLREGGLLPLQVLGEFSHVARRKLGFNATQTTALITSWLPLVRGEPYGAADLEAALRVVGEHDLPFWDALIWAVCERVGVDTLVTEDFQNGRRLGRVTFLDPFEPTNAVRLGLDRV